MAILQQCRCGKVFSSSASDYSFLCDDCNGTNAQKRAEEDRWRALPLEQKIEELRDRITSLEQSSRWDGRIG